MSFISDKCIFCCVFSQEKYVEMFYILLESIFIFGNLENTDILVYTSSVFMEKIKNSHLFDSKIKFEINDTYDNIDKACKARLDLFHLDSVKNYNKILYLDTDIIIKDDINKVFDVCVEDILYVLEEGEIDSDTDFWGKTLFVDDIYPDKSAFTSGILLFNNCKKISDLFDEINEDIRKRPYNFSCYDQPYIVYNAFKYNLYNNKILKTLAVNNDHNIHSDKVIHHFPGGPGVYQYKILLMNNFLNNSKKIYKKKYEFIKESILTNGFTMVSSERLENVYNQCKRFNDTNYSFVECGVAKGGCLAMMKFASGNNKVFGFDSFEGMPNITKEDLGDYNKSDPIFWIGKLNESGNNVYNTFNSLNLNMKNVTLVKGYFKDTLQVQENIDNIGEIAVLRLDGDWYESTKICLEKLYDNVINGGVIIIDDYGHFLGAKTATDEFRKKHGIISPLIQTDCTEYYWIKESTRYIIQVGSHIGNTSNDLLFNNIDPAFKYILIEPVPHLFVKLQENYKSYDNIVLLNIAISNYDGFLELYVPSEENDFTKLVPWVSQLASVNKNHIQTFVPSCIVDKMTVECITLNTLIKKYNLKNIEYLYIDAEGHDYDILMDLNLSFRPKNILFENKHMDGPKYSFDIYDCKNYLKLLNHFKLYGYEVETQDSENTHIQLFKTLNIEDDLWTCSSKMRYDIYDFFKDKSEFKIAEIGSHKGYSTKVLSKIFSKVYAVDNSIEWTNFNKNFNKDSTNVEYVMLDIYKNSWGILPDDIEVSFIDADHSYNGCKSDIMNSIKRFKNLQYIIFDDYGVWNGVKQIVDELIDNKTLNFERFIGINDILGPDGIVKNTYEGIICSINKFTNIVNKTYSWVNSHITFLDNFKMDAFGEGQYKIMDKQTVVAFFGGREHTITFNNDFTTFISIRDDLEFVKGCVNNIVNKSYNWENSYVTFLDNFKMDAFGEGQYKIMDKQTVVVFFGGREHTITFNDNYTSFTSIRDDYEIVTGKSLKTTKHISFYFSEDRIKYINNIIEETNKYDYKTDIFIHTNIDLQNIFNEYTNGNITIIYHDLTNIHPFYLTWKCRELLQQQRNDYDIFMYIEDDILVPNKAIQYWLKYNKKLIEMNYNLGFVRIEIENNIEYITDICEKFDTIIDGYCVNNNKPYCAFWIYNKNEFGKFVDSKYYDINNITGYDVRERSAIGLHGLWTDWYKSTLIPIVDNKLIESCKIYHMSNNYASDKNTPAKLKFYEAI